MRLLKIYYHHSGASLKLTPKKVKNQIEADTEKGSNMGRTEGRVRCKSGFRKKNKHKTKTRTKKLESGDGSNDWEECQRLEMIK